MSINAFAAPLVLRDGVVTQLERIPLTALEGTAYNEQYVQDLVFKAPSSLPITDIDAAYSELVPICKELNTRAGSIDAFYATATGRLVLLEAKLWRNPEARRKVVAQILDYARDLSTWDYEDLQREVSKALKRKGNVLYELVHSQYPDTDEARFVDEVQQSLRRGRFLLLIVGDGIREGAAGITNFLETVGSSEFTFGLVEVALYTAPDFGTLVQPRVIARTVVLQRVVIELPEGASIASEQSGEGEDLSPEQQFYKAFWTEFLAELWLDDSSQPIPRPTRVTNLYFAMPPSGGTSWVAAFFSKTRSTVGVYLRFAKGPFSDLAYRRLLEERQAIDDEIGIELEWDDERQTMVAYRPISDIFASKHRREINEFFADSVNRFVNVFRPRLERIVRESQSV